MDSTRKLTPRQIARRKAIIHTVKERLNKEDFENLSMRKIAMEAGVSPSTLYQIYHSKEDLFLAALRDSILLYPEEEVDFEPGIGRLLARLQRVSNSLSKTGKISSKLLFQSEKNTPITELLLVGAFKARKKSLLEMQKANQIVQEMDVDLYARMLVDVTWGSVLFYVKGIIDVSSLTFELIRASFSLLLSVATQEGRPLMQEILDSYSKQCQIEAAFKNPRYYDSNPI